MIGRWLDRHAEHAADRVALRFDGAATTYGELARAVDATAAALSARGVGRGDRVGFLGHNHPSQLVLLFALARLGAIQVPPDGLPVLFGPDHPTTGGYPVVGVLTAAASDLLAQVRPGEQVVLRWVAS